LENRFYRDYTGQDILDISEKAYIPIIEGILYKNDLSLLIGKYKSNKSIFAMQLACSISSGSPFLGVFEVPEPQVVWYFATEGKDNDIKDRFLRMSSVIKTDLNNIVLICSTQLKFNTLSGQKCANEIMMKYHTKLPALIIIDSLYSGFKGTLIKDDQVNEFITTIRHLMEFCNDSACLMTHHMTKEQKDNEGRTLPQSDANAYGSVFLLGQADTCFTIEKCKKNKDDRILKCENERSGKTIESLRVKFHEPEPLYLTLVSNHTEEEKKILHMLYGYKDGLDAKELRKLTNIKKTQVYVVLGELLMKGKIIKDKTHGGIYTLARGDS